MFYSYIKASSRENTVKKFPSLVLFRNMIMLQHLIKYFPLYYRSVGHLREGKTKRKFQTFWALEVFPVGVAYERWSFTRGSKYSDLQTFKLLVFWKTAHWREVVTTLVSVVQNCHLNTEMHCCCFQYWLFIFEPLQVLSWKQMQKAALHQLLSR